LRFGCRASRICSCLPESNGSVSVKIVRKATPIYASETLSSRSIRTLDPELIFGTLFDCIGLNQIPDELLRHLAIAHLYIP